MYTEYRRDCKICAKEIIAGEGGRGVTRVGKGRSSLVSQGCYCPCGLRPSGHSLRLLNMRRETGLFYSGRICSAQAPSFNRTYAGMSAVKAWKSMPYFFNLY